MSVELPLLVVDQMHRLSAAAASDHRRVAVRLGHGRIGLLDRIRLMLIVWGKKLACVQILAFLSRVAQRLDTLAAAVATDAAQTAQASNAGRVASSLHGLPLGQHRQLGKHLVTIANVPKLQCVLLNPWGRQHKIILINNLNQILKINDSPPPNNFFICLCLHKRQCRRRRI